MKFTSSIVLKFVLSLLIGLSFSFAFAFPYFSDVAYTLLDKFSLVAVPALALTVIVYCMLSQESWTHTSFPSKFLMLGLAFMVAIIFLRTIRTSFLLQLIANIISLTTICSALIFPSVDCLQKTIEAKEHFHLLSGWLLASVASFFVTGFWSSFYINLYKIALLIVFSQLILGVFFYYVIGRIKSFLQKDVIEFWIALSLFILLIIFQALIFRMSLQFTNLFNANLFLLEGKEIILFITVSIIFLPWLAWVLNMLKKPAFNIFFIQNKLIAFVRENFPGLLFSALFFSLYLLIGSVLNHPRFDVDDIFFDADGFIWRFRLTTDHWQDFYWRSVHPLALLILKPVVNFLSILLNGNVYFAAILLTAAAGAACVFLTWVFMKETLRNIVSALIMASLLGISTSHLILGSLIETYIFLAATTLFFFVLMQKGNRSMPLLVSVGVVTMGITLTNFAQTTIALFGAKPNFKFIVKYVIVVVMLVVSFTLVSNLFYPNANPYFYVPSSFLAERQNVRPVSLNRAQALVRAFLFDNIAAPSPLLSHKDIPFTQFRFYRAEDYMISEYSTSLQSATQWTWFGFLAVAIIFFVKDFKSHNIKLTLSLMACVLFNLLFHLRYGKELFLYSPNWTYAVILLLGISWRNLFAHKWFQILLIAFLVLLMFNNTTLLYTIMNISSPYIR